LNKFINYGPTTEPVVLVHEHSDALRALLLQALLDSGLSCTEVVQDAGAVMSRLESAGANVLLLDLEAPDADTLALCHAVRMRHPRLGIVATCTRGEEQRMARCLAAGADQVLIKPLTAVEIAAHIRRLHERAITWSRQDTEQTLASPNTDQRMRF
jgi:DNA-binding response OmpR family regulator